LRYVHEKPKTIIDDLYNINLMKSFERVWKSIVSCEGEEFSTIKGLRFTYRVRGNILLPSRTDYALSKANFEKAYRMMPLKGPGAISKIVRGPSYVWAIIHDPRITE